MTYVKMNEEGFVEETRNTGLEEDGFIKLEIEKPFADGEQIFFCKIEKRIVVEMDEEGKEIEIEKNFPMLDEGKWANRLKEREEEKALWEEQQKEEEKVEIAQRMFTPMLMRMATPMMADEEGEELLPILPIWEVGKTYKQGEIIKHKDLAYRIVPEQVIAQEHQPPDGTGLLAVYRPLSPNQDIADGSKEKPYEFTEGMDVFKGKYYTYEGKLYTPDRDVPNCTYYPGRAGVHFWLLVEDEPKEPIPREPEPVEPEPEKPIEPTIKEWKQPLGVQDAYAVGVKVTYQGKTWENSHPNNTYAPGVYGWKVISG